MGYLHERFAGQQRVNLDDFRGIAAVGGFSYADVPESAKGWAATILFNPSGSRSSSKISTSGPIPFRLGICNGCQLFGLIGWVPGLVLSRERQPRFIRNLSGRFESRWTTVKVKNSQAMMLRAWKSWYSAFMSITAKADSISPTPSLLDKLKAADWCRWSLSMTTASPPSLPLQSQWLAEGFAGLCSADGRHLALMPHPERVFLPWQAH